MSGEAAKAPIPGAFAYNVADVAALCRVSVRQVQQATTDGDIAASYPHSDARYTPEAVADWVSSWPPQPAKRR